MLAGWALASFDDVFSDETGGNAKTLQSEFANSGHYPIVDQGKTLIAGFTNDPTRLCRSSSPVIVFGDHTRAVKFIDFPFCLGADGTKILKPRIGADPKFLFHYLCALSLPDAGYSRHFKYLKRVSVPLPPVGEQRRIAAILDQADSLRAKQRAVRAQLDKMAQAIFVEMFGDLRANTMQWPIVPVSHYVAAFQGGKSIEADGDDKLARRRVLKVSAVTGMTFKPMESKPLPNEYTPPPEHHVQLGDLLFSRANTTELVGAVAYVSEQPSNLVLPDKLWRFVWHSPANADPLFVWALFQMPTIREEIGRRATGTSGSMKNISQEKLMAMPTILPPLPIQEVFARRYRALEQLKSQQVLSTVTSDALFASLQHRAFRGEL